MARQRIMHGATIEAATPAEIEAIIQQGNPIDEGDRARQSGYSGLYDVVIGDFDHPEPVLLTSPPARRLRVTRHGRGGDSLTIATTLTQICVANEGRLGLQIVNYGANNLFVYLAAPDDINAISTNNVPTMWLAKGGGSWDGGFELGLWGGNVTVKADAATTTITLVEL